jgi:hypothetical protein
LHSWYRFIHLASFHIYLPWVYPLLLLSILHRQRVISANRSGLWGSSFRVIALTFT